MDRKAQDVVVASLRENLGDVGLTVPSDRKSSCAISLRVLVSHTRRRISTSTSVSAAASEKMLCWARGKVE